MVPKYQVNPRKNPLEELSALLMKRFEDKGIVDEIEVFNKLQQQGSVMDYQEQFES